MHTTALGKEVLNQQLKVTELAIDFPVCDNNNIVMLLPLQSIQIQIFQRPCKCLLQGVVSSMFIILHQLFNLSQIIRHRLDFVQSNEEHKTREHFNVRYELLCSRQLFYRL